MTRIPIRGWTALCGRSVGTIWRWVRQGCDLNSPASINEYLEGNRLRQHANLIRKTTTKSVQNGTKLVDEQAGLDLNSIELAPVGRRGAAAALQRLEEIEERAQARLMRAIDAGDQFQVKACQEFYLRSSETLRRLDAAVETERRKSDEQVPLFLVEQISARISGWLRSAFEEFLSAETVCLMDIDNLGEFKAHAVERFKGLLHPKVKASLRSNPPIPPWAAEQVVEAWNIPTL